MNTLFISFLRGNKIEKQVFSNMTKENAALKIVEFTTREDIAKLEYSLREMFTPLTATDRNNFHYTY